MINLLGRELRENLQNSNPHHHRHNDEEYPGTEKWMQL